MEIDLTSFVSLSLEASAGDLTDDAAVAAAPREEEVLEGTFSAINET